MFSSRISLSDRAVFARHLSMMMKSGMALSESLRALETEASPPLFRRLISSIAGDIEGGVKLSVALSRHPKDFDPFFVSVIEVSEESGTLAENLEFLYRQLARESRMRKKIQGILLYPLLILGASVVMGALISLFVLPRLLDLFVSLDVALPPSTKALMWFAELMRDHGVEIFLGLGVLFAGLKFLVRFPNIKPLWHATLLRIPVLGTFLRNMALTRLFRGLGIMMKSGLPLVHSLRVEERSLSNRVFVRYARELGNRVARGTELSAALLGPEFRHVPQIAVKMIAVGERTGKLDESFFFLADFFDEEASMTARRFATILEPALLFVIAGIVLFIALSVITPIYSLTGSLQR